MVQRHVQLYMGSRVVAAVLNFACVAVFARMAGPAAFGEYLIAFAWAYIVYGFTIQWLRFSFFAGFRNDDDISQIATFTSLVLVSIAIIACSGLVLGFSGLMATGRLVSTLLLVIAFAVYDAAHEIGRSQLKAEAVASTTILRACLMLGLGAASIYYIGTAMALVSAVAIAHLLAILPLARHVLPHMHGGIQQVVALRFFSYGWPLILAFGMISLGQNMDRLMLEHWTGIEAVGAYGAVGNVIKQSFTVVSEGIAGAYIAIAKRAAADGNDAHATDVLRQAFRALAATAAFGVVAFLTIGDIAVAMLVGDIFWKPVVDTVPILLLASVLMSFRMYYFGQVIFFAKSSRIELAVSIADVCSVVIAGTLLIPRFGIAGAGAALLCGQFVGCLTYAIRGRRLYAMPVSFTDLIGIAGCAASGYLICKLANYMLPIRSVSFSLDLLVLAAAFAVAVKMYDLFGMGNFITQIWRRGRAVVERP
jgi:O-antigen/teichoic acid export membrane protein